MVSIWAGPAAGSLLQAVATEPSTANNAWLPLDEDEAYAIDGPGVAGSAGSARRPSWLTYTEPRPPPRPAATPISMAAARRSVRSVVGPHANSTSRCLILTSCHSRENAKFGR